MVPTTMVGVGQEKKNIYFYFSILIYQGDGGVVATVNINT